MYSIEQNDCFTSEQTYERISKMKIWGLLCYLVDNFEEKYVTYSSYSYIFWRYQISDSKSTLHLEILLGLTCELLFRPIKNFTERRVFFSYRKIICY